MTDSRRAIPGEADIPLHVRVKGEQLTIGVEGNVILVTVTAADQLHRLAVRIDFRDPTTGGHDPHGVSTGIPHPRQQLVLLPIAGNSRVTDFRQLSVVAGANVKRFAIGAERDRMRTMFAFPADFAQQFDLVVLVVIVGVRHPVQPRGFTVALMSHDVERTESTKQAVSSADVYLNGLNPGEIACGVQRDAVELAVLVGGDQPTLGVGREADPGTLFPRDLVQRGQLKSFRHPQSCLRGPLGRELASKRELANKQGAHEQT